MTFWNYPETKSGVRKMGPIQSAPSLSGGSFGFQRLYGFSALYGENSRITEPGGVWDIVLKEYCQGFRDRPAWGIATADFHQEGEGGEKLGNYQTVFYVKKRK